MAAAEGRGAAGGSDEEAVPLAAAASGGFGAYGARFGMLGMFSLLSAANAMLWITFAPISAVAEQYYGVSAFGVNLLSLVFMLAYLPAGFPASAVIDRPLHGLRRGVVLGAWLNALAALLRVLPWPAVPAADVASARAAKYAMALAGQLVAALAQSFLLATPPKLAQNWFPPRERVTASGAAAMCNQAGIAAGFFLSPAVVRDRLDRVPYLMLLQAAACVGCALLVHTLFRDSPPSPPSSSAALARPAAHAPVRETLRRMLERRAFVVLAACSGTAIGVFYALSTLLGQTMDAAGYSSTDAGLAGVTLVLVGLAGAVACSVVAARLERYHKAVLVFMLAGMLGSTVWVAEAVRPDNRASLFGSMAAFGFFSTAVLPVSFDLAVESTFPLPETAACTALMMAAQVVGIVLVLALTYPASQGLGGVRATNGTLVCVTGAALAAFSALYHGEYHRLGAEEKAREADLSCE